jgi:hypothetical protein
VDVTRGDVVLLEASLPHLSYSVHGIFSTVWFVDPSHLLAFLESHVLSELGPLVREALDPHCYACVQSPMTLRLPFSQKVHKNNPLLPMSVVGRPDGSFSLFPPPPDTLVTKPIGIVLAGLLTRFPGPLPPSFTTSSSIPPFPHIHSLPLLPQDTFRVSPALLQQYVPATHGSAVWAGGNFAPQQGSRELVDVERVIHYIRLVYGSVDCRYNNLIMRRDGSWECTLHPGLYCTQIRGFHQNHYTYVGALSGGAVHYMRCPDSDCRDSILLEENVALLRYTDDGPSLLQCIDEYTEEEEENHTGKKSKTQGDESVVSHKG